MLVLLFSPPTYICPPFLFWTKYGNNLIAQQCFALLNPGNDPEDLLSPANHKSGCGHFPWHSWNFPKLALSTSLASPYWNHFCCLLTASPWSRSLDRLWPRLGSRPAHQQQEQVLLSDTHFKRKPNLNVKNTLCTYWNGIFKYLSQVHKLKACFCSSLAAVPGSPPHILLSGA